MSSEGLAYRSKTRSRCMSDALPFHFWRSCSAITFFWYKAASTTKWRGGHVQHEDRWRPKLHNVSYTHAVLVQVHSESLTHTLISIQQPLSSVSLYCATAHNRVQQHEHACREWGGAKTILTHTCPWLYRKNRNNRRRTILLWMKGHANIRCYKCCPPFHY